MTTVYFIRHAESDLSVRDECSRPLTEKGLNDRALVTEFLSDKNIDVILSSPYKRAMNTIHDFADRINLPIRIIDDFRERKVDTFWNDDFWSFSEKQWADFSYKMPGGECLAEVQERNIAALNRAIEQYRDKNIAVGTHGTALSTIINYYDPSYNFDNFMAMVNIMPWAVIMDFDENGCAGMKKIDLFHMI